MKTYRPGAKLFKDFPCNTVKFSFPCLPTIQYGTQFSAYFSILTQLLGLCLRIPLKLCVSEIMFFVKDIWILLALHVHTQEALSLKINTLTLAQLLHNIMQVYSYPQIATYWCIICYQYNLLWRAQLCIIYVISTAKMYQVGINTPNHKILNVLCSIYHNYLLSVSCDILPIKLFINNSIIFIA